MTSGRAGLAVGSPGGGRGNQVVVIRIFGFGSAAKRKVAKMRDLSRRVRGRRAR